MAQPYNDALLKAVALHLATEWARTGDWDQDVATLGPLVTNMFQGQGFDTHALAIRSLIEILPEDSDEYELLHTKIMTLQGNRRKLKDFFHRRFNQGRLFTAYINTRIGDIGDIRDRLLGHFGDVNPLTHATLQNLLEDEDTVMEIMEDGTYVDPRSNQYQYNFFFIEFLAESEISR